MTQEEFNAWLAAQGGPSAVQHSKTNKTIPNPAKQDPASKIDDTIPPTITVSTLTWVNKRTGAKLSLIPDGPGQYTIDEQIDSDPAKPASTSAVQPGQVQGVPNNPTIQEQQADGSWVTKPNPGYVPPAGAAGTITERADGVYIIKPDGSTVKTDLPAKPAAGTHTQVKGGDGKVYVVTVAADGTVTTQDSGVPAEPKKQETRTEGGKTFVIERDADGNVTGEREVPRTEINNAPPVSATGWTPDLTKPAYGLQERYAELARRQSLAPTDPDHLSASQAKSLYDQDKAVAETELARVQSITSVQSGLHGQDITQRGQDQVVVNQRLTSGHNATTSALAAAQAGHHGGAATLQLLDMYYRQAERYGGLKDIPREALPPALARINALDPFGPGGATSGAPVAPVQPTPYDPAPTRSLAPAPQPAGPPDTGPLPMMPTAPSATPLPVGLTNIPTTAGLPVPAGGYLTDSAAAAAGWQVRPSVPASLPVGALPAPVASPAIPGFDPRQIAGLDPQAALRQQIIRQHFAGLLGGGF